MASLVVVMASLVVAMASLVVVVVRPVGQSSSRCFCSCGTKTAAVVAAAAAVVAAAGQQYWCMRTPCSQHD
jgi:hypothetical protein